MVGRQRLVRRLPGGEQILRATAIRTTASVLLRHVVERDLDVPVGLAHRLALDVERLEGRRSNGRVRRNQLRSPGSL